MNVERRFSRWLAIGDANTPAGCALLEEQFRTLRKQIPILYAVLLINALSLSYAVQNSAPPALTLWFSGFLLFVVVVRMIHWLRHRHSTPAAHEILKQLHKTRILAGLLSIGFGVWGLLIFEYADHGQQAFVTLFIYMSSVGCAYCLSSFPSAARLTLLFAAFPMALRLIVSGDGLLFGMGLNLALVSVLILRMLDAYYDCFVELVSSRTEVIVERERARNAEAVALAEKAKAKEIADTDALTKLRNRRAFLKALDRFIAEPRAQDLGFAVGMIDLDGFKPINDAFGHAVGDAILRQVAERLVEVAGTGSIVARLGGDEFAILLPSFSCAKAAKQKGEE